MKLSRRPRFVSFLSEPRKTSTSRTTFVAVVALMIVCLGGSLLAQVPVPLVNNPLVPSAATPGGAAFTLTVNGTGFVSGATVFWNGSARTTTFVNGSRLTASILASDITTAKTASVTVQNQSGGALSNVAYFEVVAKFTNAAITRKDIPCGANPQAVAVADFNGDGKQDLAVLNGNGNTISIFLGNGDGTFQTPTTSYPVANGFPVAIAVGDVNNDGKLDLVVADQRIGEISVLLGNGDGTFQTHKDFATGNSPVAVVLGDFNGDGKLDVATANYTDNTVSILLGDGTGSFGTNHDYSTGVNPQAIAEGDVNGDGKIDLVVANNNDGTISVLLGNGDGTFPVTSPTYTTAAVPTGIVLGDFNKDGKLDVAVSTAAVKVSMLLGNGDGTFQTHVDYVAGNNSQWITYGDFNGDGALDVAVANFTDNDLSILTGKGTGVLNNQSIYLTNLGPGWVSAGDFNNDGKLDLVSTDSSANTLSVSLQGAISITPTFLGYGNQQAGFTSTAKTVTLTNGSASTITIASIVPSGPNMSEYAQTNTCGSSLAAGAKCTFSVTFTPNSMGNGKTAFWTINLGDGSALGFEGTGSGVISIDFGPRKVTYKTTLVGQSSPPTTFTFTNISGVTITNLSSLVNGVDPTSFPETAYNCPTNLGAGQSCTMQVTFEPQIAQKGLTAALNVFGGFSPGNGQQASLLTGTGTDVSLNPTSLTFAPQTVGTTSNPKVVTLMNVGSAALQVTKIVMTGANPGDFNETDNCIPTVPAGGSCTINVTFTPTQTGSRTAVMNIADSDPTGQQTVNLNGPGQ